MFTRTEYEAAIERVRKLAYMDPEKPTPESDELIALAEECEAYERAHYPEMFAKPDAH